MVDVSVQQGRPARPPDRVRRGPRRGWYCRRSHGRRGGAFSLIELVVVVMIIAIIASIAARRLSRHAEQSAASAARQCESVLQLAVERYRAEHGSYPSAADVVEQLTKYTDANGVASD